MIKVPLYKSSKILNLVSKKWLPLGKTLLERKHKEGFWGVGNISSFDLGGSSLCVHLWKLEVWHMIWLPFLCICSTTIKRKLKKMRWDNIKCKAELKLDPCFGTIWKI